MGYYISKDLKIQYLSSNSCKMCMNGSAALKTQQGMCFSNTLTLSLKGLQSLLFKIKLPKYVIKLNRMLVLYLEV